MRAPVGAEAMLQMGISGQAPESSPVLHSRRRPEGRVRYRYPPTACGICRQRKMDDPVSDPSFPFAIKRKQRVNAKLPGADTNRSRESGPSFRMRPGKEFIIA